MNRTKFFKKVIVDGVEELDFIDNNLTKFVMRREVNYYRLSSIDRKRPDVISFKNYGIVHFWWLILLVSGIEDPFFETAIGRIVRIPDILDINDFYRKYKVR